MDRITSGIMTGATQVVAINTIRMPFTVTLMSADGGRKIELSTSNEDEYFQPAYDTSTASMLVCSVSSPVTHVKFTGAASDAFYIV